jgi:soluble lytic murein transglycosylase
VIGGGPVGCLRRLKPAAAGLTILAVLALPPALSAVPEQPLARSQDAAQAAQPRPTEHPPLPPDLDHYWLVPAPGWAPARSDIVSAARSLARAATLIGAEKPGQALPYIRASALAATPLAGYAAYLTGLAQLGLERYEDARRTLTALRASQPPGFLTEAAGLQLAEVSAALGDHPSAVALYDDVLSKAPATPDDVLLRLARAALKARNRARALTAYESLYYDWPGSEAAASAEDEMPASDMPPLAPGSARFNRELARAERLFADRRYAPARESFERLVPAASGDPAELVALRLAESDYFLRRYQRVREDLKPLLQSASRRAEARYYFVMTSRHTGSRDEYVALTRALVDEFPSSSWAEDALNSLASFHLLNDEDDKADGVYRELASRFPAGRYSARAQWRLGWWAFRHQRYAEAAETFASAAVAFPRSDFRPSCLYWMAQARDRLGDRTTADDGFRLVVADYANSYYGRLASKLLAARGAGLRSPEQLTRLVTSEPAGEAAPPTATLIRWLIAIEMYDEALDEVQYAERAWGKSTSLEATRAWLLNRTGELRPAINLMRQTYPQFLAAGGESMPTEVLAVIFPLDYWPLIQQHANLHKLDPFLVAALVAQESTFDKDAVSAANAIGLMQIMPTTGRSWARRLGIRAYSSRKLRVADVNVRIGTAYYAELKKQFGHDHVALAAYNAGENRAVRWLRERQGLPRDEFIDDIPFTETQGYVRRILGTAEDYRRLYGSRERPAAPAASSAPKPVVIRKK